MIDELLALSAYFVNGFHKLGQQVFDTDRCNELVGRFDQSGHLDDRFPVLLDVKRFGIFGFGRRLAGVKFICQRAGGQQQRVGSLDGLAQLVDNSYYMSPTAAKPVKIVCNPVFIGVPFLSDPVCTKSSGIGCGDHPADKAPFVIKLQRQAIDAAYDLIASP